MLNGITVPHATLLPTLNLKWGATLAPVPPAGTFAKDAAPCVIVMPGVVVVIVP